MVIHSFCFEKWFLADSQNCLHLHYSDLVSVCISCWDHYNASQLFSFQLSWQTEALHRQSNVKTTEYSHMHLGNQKKQRFLWSAVIYIVWRRTADRKGPKPSSISPFYHPAEAPLRKELMSRTNRLRFLKPWSGTCSPIGHRKWWHQDPRSQQKLQSQILSAFSLPIPRNPCQIYPITLPMYWGNGAVAEKKLYLKILCNFVTVNSQLRDFHCLKDSAATRA